ncbi:DNA alkylation repair enzyme [anaerobic digester metagenome]
MLSVYIFIGIIVFLNRCPVYLIQTDFMKAEELFQKLKSYCIEHANPELVTKYSRYFKEGVYDAWGLSQALMDAKKDELKKAGNLTVDLVFDTAPLLMKSGKYEETSFVLILLSLVKDKLQKTDIQRIENLFETGIRNWAHADYLGMFFLPELMKQDLMGKEDFRGWVTSPYKFQRRCVPVTFIKLLKTGIAFQELFTFLEPLMLDPEREVHQGMGWFLREAWKLKNAETETFLLKWKDSAPRLIIQYACEKMDKTNKARFRRAK